MQQDVMNERLANILRMIKYRKVELLRINSYIKKIDKVGVDYFISIDKEINELYTYAESTLKLFGVDKKLIRKIYK